MESEAALSYKPHSRDKDESGSTDEMYKKNKWAGKMYRELGEYGNYISIH